MNIGEVGIWGSSDWFNASPAVIREVASELEELGYGTLWIAGGSARGIPDFFRDALGGTERMTVASGIINIWADDATHISDDVAALEQQTPGRFLLGLGASHAVAVERTGEQYKRPYSKMVSYLDQLDALPSGVPQNRRVLAALGPKMLRLSAERSLGAHPYFVPVEHTAFAREVLGTGPLLAPEQAVVLESRPDVARAIAREHMKLYLTLPNYTNNLQRFGFTEDDISGGGSDRLVDAIVAWGDVGAIVERIQAHRNAGADHVCLQVLGADAGFPRSQFRAISAGLRG
jgi:probable F420-dependent oxidoreductase